MIIYEVIYNGKPVGNAAFVDIYHAISYLESCIRENSGNDIDSDTDILTVQYIRKSNPESIICMPFTKFNICIRTVNIVDM